MIKSVLNYTTKSMFILSLLALTQCKSDTNQNQPIEETQATPIINNDGTEYKADKEGWIVSLDEAYEISQKTGKPIMANFTGSDWCGWCKRLDAAVFSKPEFKKWADNNIVLLELDFPRRKTIPDHIRQQNHELQNAFQVRGYPTVQVFNLTKNLQTDQFNIEALGKTGYVASVDEFINNIEAMIHR